MKNLNLIRQVIVQKQKKWKSQEAYDIYVKGLKNQKNIPELRNNPKSPVSFDIYTPSKKEKSNKETKVDIPKKEKEYFIGLLEKQRPDLDPIETLEKLSEFEDDRVSVLGLDWILKSTLDLDKNMDVFKDVAAELLFIFPGDEVKFNPADCGGPNECMYMFNNKSKKIKGEWVKDKQEGLWEEETSLYEGHLEKDKGFYKNGKKIGKWETTIIEDGDKSKIESEFENGELVKKTSFGKLNKLTGETTLNIFHFEGGKNTTNEKGVHVDYSLINKKDDNGDKIGWWNEMSFDSIAAEETIFGELDTIITQKGLYKKNKREGTWQIDENLDEEDLEYNCNEICEYVNGEKTGISTKTTLDGCNDIYEKQTGNYKNGIREGEWEKEEEQLINGDLKTTKGRYKNGKKNGLWSLVGEGGNFFHEEGNYIDDKKEGNWKREIYEDTIKVEESHYYENNKKIKDKSKFNMSVPNNTYEDDEITEKTRNLKYERATVYTNDGELVNRFTDKKRGSVSFHAPKGSLVVHNHPNGSPLSDKDLSNLLTVSRPHKKTIKAIGSIFGYDTNYSFTVEDNLSKETKLDIKKVVLLRSHSDDTLKKMEKSKIISFEEMNFLLWNREAKEKQKKLKDGNLPAEYDIDLAPELEEKFEKLEKLYQEYSQKEMSLKNSLKI